MQISEAAARPLSRQVWFFLFISLVFFFSGFAALIYQVVWQRAFTLYYGVGAISVSVIVSAFLLGLGAGAFAGGWLAERHRWRLWLYIAIEGALGIIGFFSLELFSLFIPVLSGAGYEGGFAIIFVLIALPTAMMGMTLPLVIKIVAAPHRQFGRNLGTLYFVNTFGAACGAFVCAYWLISFYGLEAAVQVAGLINLALAVLVFAAAMFTGGEAPETWNADARPVLPAQRGPFASPAFAAVAVFVTGFLAIGYQIVWFRAAGTLLKPSAYVFATVLGVYLLGVAFGSLWFSRMAARRPRAVTASLFFAVNAGLALVVLITFAGTWLGGQSGPLRWMIDTTFGQQLHPPYNLLYAFGGDTTAEYLASVYLAFDILIWPVLLVLPGAVLMGASFPLVNVLALADARREGQSLGRVYGLGVAGNAAGGLVTGFVLLPVLGTERTVLLFVVAGLLWLLGIAQWRGRAVSPAVRLGVTVAAIAVAVLALPPAQAFYGLIHPSDDRSRIITEGRDGVVVTYSRVDEDTTRTNVFINGSDHATHPSAAYRVEVLEAVTRAKSVADVLIIGFGGGDLTETVLMTPGVERVTVVEISGALIENLRQIPFYGGILDDPRVTLVIDDGRRFLAHTDHRYDMAFMDPLQSTSAYSNNIYSAEFFQLVSDHLTEDGLLMTWMNEYQVIPKTLASVFPTMYCFYYFCLSGNGAFIEDEERRNALMAAMTPQMRELMNSRMAVDYYVVGDRDRIVEQTARYPINTDFSPVTEYYIGYTLRSF